MCKKVAAFTLVEILVALTIIGVLLTFVAPYVFNRPDQARKLKVENDFLAISTALNLYKLDQGSLPEAAVAIEMLTVQNPGGVSYLAKIPLDPWNTPYQIEQVVGSNALQIISAGSDKKFSIGTSTDDLRSEIIQ